MSAQKHAPSPWSIKGIPPQAREAAKEAARREGLTLGAWLVRQIEEASEEAQQAAAAAQPLALPAPPKEDPVAVSDPRLLSALESVAKMLEHGEPFAHAHRDGDPDSVAALSSRIDGIAEMVGALSRTVTDNLKTVERAAASAEASQSAAENAVASAEAARLEAAAALRASAALAQKTIALAGGVEAPGEDWKDEVAQELSLDLDARLEALESRLAERDGAMEARLEALSAAIDQGRPAPRRLGEAAAETFDEAAAAAAVEAFAEDRDDAAYEDYDAYEEEETAEAAEAPIFVDLPGDGDLVEVRGRHRSDLEAAPMRAHELRDRLKATTARALEEPAAADPAAGETPRGALSDSIARLVDEALAEDDEEEEAIALPFWRRRAIEKRAAQEATRAAGADEAGDDDFHDDEDAPIDQERLQAEPDPIDLRAFDALTEPAVDAPARDDAPEAAPQPKSEKPAHKLSWRDMLSSLGEPAAPIRPEASASAPEDAPSSMTLDQAAGFSATEDDPEAARDAYDDEDFEEDLAEDDFAEDDFSEERRFDEEEDLAEDDVLEEDAPEEDFSEDDDPDEDDDDLGGDAAPLELGDADREDADEPRRWEVSPELSPPARRGGLDHAIERARQARAAFEEAEREPEEPLTARALSPRRAPALTSEAQLPVRAAFPFTPDRSAPQWSDQPSWREPSFSQAHVSRAARGGGREFPLEWPSEAGRVSADPRGSAIRDESGSVGYGVAISLALMALTAGAAMAALYRLGV